ncbi:hypothetical protein PQX77_012865 [Marasmius sp. AFHP31]|nr:hypothetical protein PQX77_012865 [Marasmius sp. AFHP31]
MARFFSILLLFGCLQYVRSFDFKVEGQPGQCDPISFSWTGGQAPFRLIVVVPGRVNINMSIPDSNFKDNKGTFSIDALEVARGNQTFFMMSDATGPVSGGTSSLMAVGDSTSGKNCNTTEPGGSGGTGTGTGDGSSNNQDDRGGQKLLSVGAIAGIAVGGAIIACIVIGIAWCILRRRSKSKRPRALDLSEDFTRNAQTSQTNLPSQFTPVPYPTGPGPAPAVFVAPGTNASTASFRPDHLGQSTPSASLSATSPPGSQYYDDGPTSSSGQGTSSSRRFIVHRDIDEGDAPIDLPPQYSDRRNPISGMAETSSAPAFGGRTKKG